MEPLSDSPGTGGTQVGTSSGASFLVRSELMQNYTTARAIPTSGAQLVSTRDRDGAVQLFSLGDGGQVFNLFPTAKVDSGWGLRPLHVPVDVLHFTAGSEVGGAIVVLACGSDSQVYWKSDEPFSSWLNLGTPFGNGTVQALRVGYDRTGEVIFQAITTLGDGTQGVVRIYPRRPEAPWQYVSAFINGRVYDCLPGAAALGGGSFVTSSDEDLANTNITFYQDGQIEGRAFYASSINDMVALAGAVDAGGTTQVFALSEQQQAFFLDQLAPSQDSLVPLNTTQTGGAVTFASLSASRYRPNDGGLEEALQFFGLSKSGSLYATNQQLAPALAHDSDEPGMPRLVWAPLTSLGDGLQASSGGLTVCRDEQGFTHCFAATSSGQLLHVWQDSTTDWHALPITIPYEGELVDFASYSTEITVLDATGNPVPGQNLVVRAADYLEVTVNGQPGSIGPDRSVSCQTNGAGRITVATPTGDLGVTSFQVEAPFLPEGVLSIAPDRYIQDTLYPATAADLQATLASATYTTSTGDQEPLIDMNAYGSYLPDASTAIWQSMSLAQPESGNDAATARWVSRRGDTRGVQVMERGRFGNRIDVNKVPDQFWRIEFLDKGGVRFHPLRDHDHYQQVMAELAAGARPTPQRRSSRSLHLSRPSWGNLWHSVERGAAKLESVAVAVFSTVETETQQIVRRIESSILIQGVLDMLHYVVDTVQQVFDVVEGIFDALAATFDKVFRWLGSLFDWSAILGTHDAIAELLNGFLFTQIPRTLDEVQGKVDSFFTRFTTQGVETGDLGSTTLASGQQNAVDQADQAPGPSSNWLQNQVLNSGGGSPAAEPAVSSPPGDDPLATFEQAVMQEFGGLLDSLVAQFNSAIAQGKSTNNLTPNDVLALVTEMIAKDLLVAAQTVADLAFAFAQFVVGTVAQVATSAWHIPLISKLYKEQVGSELTLLNLTALALALPVSVAMRAAGIELTTLQTVARNTTLLNRILTPAQRMGSEPLDDATRERLRAAGFVDDSAFIQSASQVMGFVYGFSLILYSPFAWLYAIDGITGKWLKAIPIFLSLAVLGFSFPLWSGLPSTSYDWITIGCWSVGFLLWFGCSALPGVIDLLPPRPLDPERQPLLPKNAPEGTKVLDLVSGTFGFVGGLFLLGGYVIQAAVEATSSDYLPDATNAERLEDVGMKAVQNLMGVLPTVALPLKWKIFEEYAGQAIFGVIAVAGTAGAGAVALVHDALSLDAERVNHII